jgi:hypothetical protein
MLLLAASALPEGTDRDYEVKLDGYRALAIKSGGRRRLRSRNNKDFVGNIRSSPAERSSATNLELYEGLEADYQHAIINHAIEYADQQTFRAERTRTGVSHIYSARSVCIGSTLAARRAGNAAASRATVVTIAMQAA